MSNDGSDESKPASTKPIPHLPTRTPPIDTTGDDPFAEDLLNRRPSAEVLTQFIERTPGPFVLALDASWGLGKTTFLDMWSESLRRSGHHCVTFNAWETDFTGDPFTALVGELKEFLSAAKVNDPDRLREAIANARAAGRQIARRGIPTLVKIATAGLINTDAISQEAEKTIAELAGELTGDFVEDYIQEKNAVESFRKEFSSAVSSIRKASLNPQFPVVVLIDELDRCRPPYALALLERVKHLFEVEGVVFVLSIDRGQLEECVRATYGRGVDARHYLRRFIDFDYRLPDPDTRAFARARIASLGLTDSFNSRISNPTYRKEDQRSDAQLLTKIFPELCAVTQMTLRQITQATARLGIALRTIPHSQTIQPVQLALLVVLRECAPEEYSRLRSRPNDFNETLKWFRAFPQGQRFLDSNEGLFIEAALVVHAQDLNPESKCIEHYNAEASSAKRDESGRNRYGEVCKRISMLTHNGFSRGLAYAAEHVELTTSFSIDYERPHPPFR